MRHLPPPAYARSPRDGLYSGPPPAQDAYGGPPPPKRRMAGLRRKGLTATHSKGLTAMLIKPYGQSLTARRKAPGGRRRSG